MTRKHLEGRVKRLQALAEGFARELALWRETCGLLLPREHQSYRCAIQNAFVGADEARVALERVLRGLMRDMP